MSGPTLLRGAAAIADYLGVSPGLVSHRHQERSIPTINVGGCPCATTGALDEWRTLLVAGKLPRAAGKPPFPSINPES